MLAKSFYTAVAVFTASVASQTFTSCNPLEKTCPAHPALGSNSIKCDFTKGKCDAFNHNPGTTINYSDKGALFSIENDKQAPTIASKKYIFFGRVDVELMASPGQGVVTSVVLQSGDLDEIDWEWVGGRNDEVQTNYFGKGDTTTYDRGAKHPVTAPLTTFHTYSIEWTSKKVDWIIDNQVVRSLNYADAKGGSRFPQTPMEIKLGTWVAGLQGNSEGTVEWAGGYTDFTKAPFQGWYKSISVVDYAGGDAPPKDSIKEYLYGDKSGSWESIKVVKGESSNDSKDDDKPSSTTLQAIPSASSTASASGTKTTGASNPAVTHSPNNGTSITPSTLPVSGANSNIMSLFGAISAVVAAAMIMPVF
ncbi:unnamed protein product [Clonostachys byssicola]|uniref:Crh-like protein n=1 Tax=Clonostachys byssicola TaxID=160290 RepID=A0A9N9UIU2_9HYPO|nr:unnamed protein product [Clonostachys byssicola]